MFMRKTFTLLFALFALCVSTWATPTTITWNAENGLTSIDLNEYTNNYWENEYHSYNYGTKTAIIEGIAATISATADGSSASFSTYEQNEENITSISVSNGGTFTFSSALYLIHSIVINFTGTGYATGWKDDTANTLTWTAEATHSVNMNDAYISGITSIVFTVEAIPTTSVTWDQTDIETISLTCNTQGDTQTASEIKGITASLTRTSGPADEYDHCQFTYRELWVNSSGELTFTSTVGDIISIVITCDEAWSYSSLSAGWSYNAGETKTLTWTGAASSAVTLSGYIDFSATSIEFIMAASSSTPTTTTTTITWDQTDVASVNVNQSNGYDSEKLSQTIKTISVTAAALESGDYSQFQTYDNKSYITIQKNGTLTFAPASGKLTRIAVNCAGATHPEEVSTGWTWNGSDKLIWSGDAATSVVLAKVGNAEYIYFDAITSIEFTVVEEASAPTTTTTKITWDETKVSTIALECSNVGDEQTASAIDGITASLKKTSNYSNYCQFKNKEIWIYESGEVTFTSSAGNISGILITCDPYNDVWSHTNLSAGWTFDGEAKTFTWTGTPSSQVKLSGYIDFLISSIEFTVESSISPDPTPATTTSTVTWDQTDLETIDARPDNPYVGVPGYQILKGISVTANAPQSGDYCHFMYAFNNSSISIQNGGTVSFAPLAGKLTNIVISCYGDPDDPENIAGWTWNNNTKELTWSGSATSPVALACVNSSGSAYIRNISSIEFTVVTEEAPANPFIIWEQRQVNHVELNSYTKDYHDVAPVIRNIIATLTRTNSNEGNCIFEGGRIAIGGCGELEFKSIVGELSSIVITCSSVTSASDLSTGWTYNSGAKTITWEGTAAEEVTLSGDIDCKVTSIKFFYTPAAAPRLGEQFQGIYDQLYQITGAQTAMMPVQQLTHTLEVPETVDYEGVTYYVTEVAENAFKNNKLPNAYIGANVGRIGAHAFEGCTIMSDISIYSHVVDEIGEQAFKDCKLMQIFECYTKQPPVLGNNAFDGDGRINHILVQYDTENAYKSADGWSNLADKVEEMSNAPYIGEIFFFNNQKTVNLYQVLALPDYFTSTNGQAKVVPYTAEVNAIYPRTLERTLVVPEEVSYVAGMKYSVTGVGANAYKNCTEVEVVLFPEGVTTIEAGAFAGCTEVMNVFFLWKDPTIVTWADANVGAEFATAASGKTKIIVPKDKLAEYQAWAPAWASCMIAGEIEDVKATQDPDSYGTSARYYRTFYDSTKDYMLPPSVWAHAGYVRGNEFILRPVAFDGEILPKGTAVVLESETAEYRLIAMENSSVPAYTGPNDLVGLDVAQTVSYVADSLNITAEQIYVLNRRATVGGELQVGMGMYRYTGTTLGAKKAFMVLRNPIDTGTSNDQPAPARFLFSHEDTATSTENVQDNNVQCTKLLRDGQLIIIRDGKEYNAQGQIIK